MKISEAISLETNEKMTAVRADILYQAKKIQDKAKFKCLGKNCTAQVTCANLDKPLAERINKLHFRIYGHHTDGCSIKKDIDNDNNLSPEKKKKNNYNHMGFILNLSSINSDIPLQPSISLSLPNAKADNHTSNNPPNSKDDIETKKQSLASLREIIDTLEHQKITTGILSIKEKKNLYKCSLPIQYKNIPSNILLNKLSIKQQNLVDASSYHFYIDQGRIYKIAPDYRINFKQTIQLDGITYNICFYINPKHINEITQQSYVKEMLDTLDKSKKYFKICILYKAIKNTKSGSRDYLQLQLDKFYLCAFWD